jgi:hypothetical protein
MAVAFFMSAFVADFVICTVMGATDVPSAIQLESFEATWIIAKYWQL